MLDGYQVGVETSPSAQLAAEPQKGKSTSDVSTPLREPLRPTAGDGLGGMRRQRIWESLGVAPGGRVDSEVMFPRNERSTQSCHCPSSGLRGWDIDAFIEE